MYFICYINCCVEQFPCLKTISKSLAIQVLIVSRLYIGRQACVIEAIDLETFPQLFEYTIGVTQIDVKVKL